MLQLSGELTCPPETAGVRLGGVTSIAVRSLHACAALRDGTVRCWGENDRGAVGQSSDLLSSRPVDVPNAP
ncbi:MAG: RCC1 domain-containing protein [Byssovorax sp.]